MKPIINIVHSIAPSALYSKPLNFTSFKHARIRGDLAALFRVGCRTEPEMNRKLELKRYFQPNLNLINHYVCATLVLKHNRNLLDELTDPNWLGKRLTKSYEPSARARKNGNIRTRLKASSSRSTNDSQDSGKTQITSSSCELKCDAFHNHQQQQRSSHSQ